MCISSNKPPFVLDGHQITISARRERVINKAKSAISRNVRHCSLLVNALLTQHAEKYQNDWTTITNPFKQPGQHVSNYYMICTKLNQKDKISPGRPHVRGWNKMMINMTTHPPLQPANVTVPLSDANIGVP